MRIAYLNPSGQLGGAEICLLDMVAVVRDVRPSWDVHIILGEEGPLHGKLEKLGARVSVLPFPLPLAVLGDSAAGPVGAAWRLLAAAPATISYRNRLKKELHKIRPEILHTNGFKMHVLGAITKPGGSELLWHVHDYVSSRPLMKRVLKQLTSKADNIITNSRSVAEDVRRSLHPVSVLPILNVVDLDEFCPQGPQLELKEVPPGRLRVGLMATMAWWKGHRLFLDAIARLDSRLPVHAVVIGGSVYRTASSQETIADLISYSERLGIRERVSFTGFAIDAASAIRSLDIVVHASTEPEPFGRVIVEAMACAKPIISSAIGGAAEILALGNFGRRFKSGDAESLAAAITDLARNPELREELGRTGIEVARAHFGRGRLATELLPVYENLATVSQINSVTNRIEVLP